MSKFHGATALSIIGLAIAACGASDRDPTNGTTKPGATPGGNGKQVSASGEIVTDTNPPPKQPGVCSPSPSNYDVPGNGCDDDGDGNVDNVVPCDGALPVTGDAATFVRALGICKTATRLRGAWCLQNTPAATTPTRRPPRANTASSPSSARS